MRVLFSIFVWTYYNILFLVFFIIISIAFLFTFPFDPYRKIPNWLLARMAWCMMQASPGWKTKMMGIEKYDPNRPTVFIGNHQSFLDMAFVFMLPWQMKWVTKRSLMLIPVMGWLAWFTGHLAIDRKSKTAIRKLDNLVAPIKDKVPVMIFPEGTRSTDGAVKSFKNGAFLLAMENDFYIQPIVIDGGYKALKSGSKVINSKVQFTLSVLDPIDTTKFTDMTELKEYSRQLIIKELERIRAL
ncbi:MAG: lysophospholipid acyltransferase family protein [Balneolaceae bacterium]